jgi:hypothetical protein
MLSGHGGRSIHDGRPGQWKSILARWCWCQSTRGARRPQRKMGGVTSAGATLLLDLTAQTATLTGTLTRRTKLAALGRQVSEKTFTFKAKCDQTEAVSGELAGDEIEVWLDRQGPGARRVEARDAQVAPPLLKRGQRLSHPARPRFSARSRTATHGFDIVDISGMPRERYWRSDAWRMPDTWCRNGRTNGQREKSAASTTDSRDRAEGRHREAVSASRSRAQIR